MRRLLIAVEGSPGALADALADARDAGREVVAGWNGRKGVVCTGVVASEEDAGAALLAVVAGSGVVLDARADRQVLDRLYDDLRRFGPVSVFTRATPRSPSLTHDERALLELMLDGLTLGEAARRLSLSRRTADRRLASVRDKLAVGTTAEALAAYAGRIS